MPPKKPASDAGSAAGSAAPSAAAGGLDWESIKSVRVDELRRDSPVQAEERARLFANLATAPGDTEAPADADWKKVFEVAQVLLVAERERFDETRRDVEELEREAEELDAELKDKEEEILRLRQADAKLGSTTGGRLRGEIADWQGKLERAQKELKTRTEELEKLKTTHAETADKCKELEIKADQLELDYNRLIRENEDFRDQLQTQREELESHDYEERNTKSLLQTKNVELERYLAELGALKDEVERFETERDQALADVDILAEEVENLKAQSGDKVTGLLEAERMLRSADTERELLRSKVVELEVQLQARQEQDDTFLDSVNQQIIDWKNQVAQREQDLADRDREVEDLRAEIRHLYGEGEAGAGVDGLRKTLNDRNDEIARLREELAEEKENIELLGEEIIIIQNQSKQTTDQAVADLRQKMHEMRVELKAAHKDAEEERRRHQIAADSLESKEGELMDLRKRYDSIQHGEYGLREALAEVKKLNTQVKVRDENVKGLTTELTQREKQLTDLVEQNSYLRRKAGIEHDEDVDIADYKLEKYVELEQVKAMNRQLRQEIDRLEEERLQLKSALRLQAVQRGERAAYLGLTSDDMQRVDQFAAQLKFGKDTPPALMDERTQSLQKESDSLRHDVHRAEKRAVLAEAEVDDVKQNLATVSEELAEVSRENRELQKVIAEINASLKSGAPLGAAAAAPAGEGAGDDAAAGGQAITSGALDRLLAGLGSRGGLADRLHGLSEETTRLSDEKKAVEAELAEARETNATLSEKLAVIRKSLQKAEEDNENLHVQVQVLSRGPQISLPEDLSQATYDDVVNLHEQLIHVLEELSAKEDELHHMGTELDAYQKRMAGAVAQQETLYSDYVTQLSEWTAKERKLLAENQELRAKEEVSGIKIAEYERLMAGLEGSDDERKARLAQAVKTATLLRVDEAQNRRKTIAVSECYHLALEDNTRLKNDLLLVEKALKEQIAYLEEAQARDKHTINQLQKTLVVSVSFDEHATLSRRYEALSRRYTIALERERDYTRRLDEKESNIQELRYLRSKTGSLEARVADAELKATRLQEGLDFVGSTTTAESAPVDEIRSAHAALLSRVTAIEVSEANARSAAELANKRYDDAYTAQQQLIERVAALDKMVVDLTGESSRQLEELTELRDRAARTLSVEEADALRASNADLEKQLAHTQAERDKHRDLLHMSTQQTQQMKQNLDDAEGICKNLREGMIALQSESDNKAEMGKLHHAVISRQLGESQARRSLQQTQTQLIRVQLNHRKLEQQLYQKDGSMFRLREESRAKLRDIQGEAETLRQASAGALPQERTEKFVDEIRKLHDRNVELEERLESMRGDFYEMQDKHAVSEIEVGSMREMLDTLEKGDEAKKLLAINDQVNELKLTEKRVLRRLNETEEREAYALKLARTYEATIKQLEEEAVAEQTAHERQRTDWRIKIEALELELLEHQRQREVVEITGINLEKQAQDHVVPPDSSMPVGAQLEDALSKLQSSHKIIVDYMRQVEDLKAENNRQALAIQDAEEKISRREDQMQELRLQQASRNIDQARTRGANIVGAAAPGDDGAEGADGEGGGRVQPSSHYLAEQLQMYAEENIDALNRQIRQKDEDLRKYQDALRRARKEHIIQKEVDAAEIARLTALVNSNADSNVATLRSALEDMESDANKHPRGFTVEQVEEIKLERDRKITTLEVQIEVTTQEVQTLKDQLRAAHESIEELQEQVRVEKERPLKIDRLVTQLKNQLQVKEKQQGELKGAIKKLRAELIKTEKEHRAVLDSAKLGDQESKATMEATTANVQQRLKDLQGKLHRLNDDFGKKRTQWELKEQELTENVERLEGALRRQVAENQRHLRTIRQGSSKEKALNAEIDNLRTSPAAAARIVELERKIKVLQSRLPPGKRGLPAAMGAAPRGPPPGGDGGGDSSGSQPSPPRGPAPVGAAGPAGSPSRQARGIPVRAREADVPEREDGAVATDGGAGEPLPAGGMTAIERWEQEKRWKKRVETLRGKLADKTKELESSQKECERLRDYVQRLSKDHENLTHRVQRLDRDRDRAGRPSSSLSAAAGPGSGSGAAGGRMDLAAAVASLESVQAVESELHAAEDEIARLQRKLNVDKAQEVQTLERENERMRERVGDFERKLTALQAELQPTQDDDDGSRVGGGLGALERDELERLRAAVAQLEKEALDKDNANLELRFETEATAVQIAKLGKRVKELERSNVILRESAASGLPRVGGSASAAAAASSSRGSRDLEEVVSSLKVVIEKQQGEIASLKRSAQSSVKYMEAVKDKKQLKKRVAELEGQVQTLEGRAHSLEDQLAQSGRLGDKYEAVYSKLKKEREKSSRLGNNLADATVDNKALRAQIEGLEKRLSESQARREALEAQLQDKENEVGRKSSLMLELKEQLQENIRTTSGRRHEDDEAGRDLERRAGDLKRRLAEARGQLQDATEAQDLAEREAAELRQDNARMRSELDAFGPNFFDEIEDLRFNYSEALKMIQNYESQLRRLSDRYGFQFVPVRG